MKRSFSRRTAIKAIGASAGAAAIAFPKGASAAEPATATHASDWHTLPNRIWLGADYWANPMEDWRIVDGAAECQTTKGDRNFTKFAFEAGDTLLLGRESAGVPQNVHDAADARLRVPMRDGERALNVAMAAAMVLGEALRQTGEFG